jgi:hypothetical protein
MVSDQLLEPMRQSTHYSYETVASRTNDLAAALGGDLLDNRCRHVLGVQEWLAKVPSSRADNESREFEPRLGE